MTLSLIGLMLTKTMIVPVLFLDYELRKDFIIKNYCVNKNRPEMHCDGKCYLAKRIKSAEEKDEKQATDQFVHQLFSQESNTHSADYSVEFSVVTISIEPVNNFNYQSPAFQQSFCTIFHPPQS
ncbi:hypothetical protein GVN16_06205 [Emticicia sp. CRIBPO]|uniref:hypothetical protein n=1 Tax=Emticicia sp. CRIBPO TaxID=2683258 RepID=UPI001412A478|nr:hypothetical protein [Emticicia sp. CRIBPO]NBA85345.1 hypothetical protein [Emticicia sp. CRIBPO]